MSSSCMFIASVFKTRPAALGVPDLMSLYSNQHTCQWCWREQCQPGQHDAPSLAVQSIGFFPFSAQHSHWPRVLRHMITNATGGHMAWNAVVFGRHVCQCDDDSCCVLLDNGPTGACMHDHHSGLDRSLWSFLHMISIPSCWQGAPLQAGV